MPTKPEQPKKESTKIITKKQLIDIFKKWPIKRAESLSEVIEDWDSPEYPIECAEHIWEKLA